MAVQTFKAHATLKENVLVETEARRHRLTIDEPESLGGTDKGMNPVELLLVSLGACQSIVARTHAEKFDIRLDAFSVELEGDLDFDGFFDKRDVRPGFSTIRYNYHIQTDAPEEKVNAFITFIENHCPVGDTIANTVKLVPGEVIITNPLFEKNNIQVVP